MNDAAGFYEAAASGLGGDFLEGRGFSYAESARMIQFAQLFPDEAIVVTLSQQLSWSHVHALLPIKDPSAGATERFRFECTIA